MNNQDFRSRLDTELSSVTWTAYDRARVLKKIDESGWAVTKKKLVYALVLALVLLMCTTGAVAATLMWRDVGEKVAPLENQNGYYETWDADAKAALVRMLYDLGELRGSADAQRLLNAADLSDAEREALSDRIMTSYVNGTTDTVTLLSILEKLHGSMETWSVEDMAWYNGLIAKTDEDMLYVLPNAEEMTEQRAKDAAIMFLSTMGEKDFSNADVEATLYAQEKDSFLGNTQIARAGERIWSVVIRKNNAVWHVDFGANGGVLNYSTPDTQNLFMTGMLSGSDGIGTEQALAIGKQALTEQYGLAQSDLAGARAYYGMINLADPEAAHAQLGEIVWQVICENGFRAILKPDGQVIYLEK